MLFRTRGKLEEAIKAHKSTVASEPGYDEAHNKIGIALRVQGEIDEAIDYFFRAIAFNPNNAAAHSNLGLALKASEKKLDNENLC